MSYDPARPNTYDTAGSLEDNHKHHQIAAGDHMSPDSLDHEEAHGSHWELLVADRKDLPWVIGSASLHKSLNENGLVSEGVMGSDIAE